MPPKRLVSEVFNRSFLKMVRLKEAHDYYRATFEKVHAFKLCLMVLTIDEIS